MIVSFYYILHIFVLFFLLFPAVLVLLVQLVPRRRLQPIPDNAYQHDFACIITAYQNIDIALPLIDSLLKQQYEHFTVYLVTDDCQTVPQINDSRVVVLNPPQKLGSKVKSMQYAIANFVRNHEYIVIFDPDNLAITTLLRQYNQYIHNGYKAVQARRTAKNLDTIYACADATGEIYKNYIERFVPYHLGSSATIAGSGMAVESQLFNGFLQSRAITQLLQVGRVVVAEDKILHNYLVKNGTVIAYANEALVYDEKVTEAQQVTRQRTRWIYAYFENIDNSLRFLWQGIISFNWNQFLFGIFSVYPPLFLLLLAALGLAAFDIFFNHFLLFLSVLSIIVFSANILLTLYLSRAPKAVWSALWGIPLFIGQQILALLQLRKAKNDFLTTRHTRKITIDQLPE
ncbi:MAG TPA: glycosyltransferase [Chitinophagales bacterium]|nr:glycosyltransferase [Chitinophagales bacterium]